MSFLSRVKVVANNHDYFTAEDLDSEVFEGLQDDYEEAENPDPSIRKFGKKAIDQCLEDLPFWDRVSIYYSDELDEQYLAKLRSETESKPIIIVSPKNMLIASKKYHVPLVDTVETTIFHEFGHAVVALAEVEEYEFDYQDEEDFVEEYAQGIWSGKGSNTSNQFKDFLKFFLGND